MRMSRASAYAIGAILLLADEPKGVPVPCSKIAKTGEMPERFLLQVLRNLVNHGVLKSTRGVDGGYYLLRPLSEITLLHIIEATDGPLSGVAPLLDNIPENSRTRLQDVLNTVSGEFCQSLEKVRLIELLSPTSNQTRLQIPK